MKRDVVAQVSAVVYVLWGLLHLQAAFFVYKLGASLTPGVMQGRTFQNAWNLLFASIVAIAVALAMNWRNRHDGYWINAILVGLVDLGFIFFVLIPGYLPLWPGLLGPVTWLMAWTLSTVAYLQSRQPAQAGAAATAF